MPPPVFSHQFLYGAIPYPDALKYAVPEGYRAVIRDATLLYWSAATGKAWLATEGGPAFLGLPDSQSPGYGVHWDGRFCLDFPGQLVCFADGAGLNISVSGYLLTLS